MEITHLPARASDGLAAQATSRLQQVTWAMTRQDYILTTAARGRVRGRRRQRRSRLLTGQCLIGWDLNYLRQRRTRAIGLTTQQPLESLKRSLLKRAMMLKFSRGQLLQCHITASLTDQATSRRQQVTGSMLRRRLKGLKWNRKTTRVRIPAVWRRKREEASRGNVGEVNGASFAR